MAAIDFLALEKRNGRVLSLKARLISRGCEESSRCSTSLMRRQTNPVKVRMVLIFTLGFYPDIAEINAKAASAAKILQRIYLEAQKRQRPVRR